MEVGKAFAENGLSQQAHQSFTEALTMAKSKAGTKAATTLKIMKEYANFLRKQGKTEESSNYEAQADYSVLNGTDDKPIGTAKVETDGTVLLSLNADGPEFHGHASIAYAPSNEKYSEIILHLGAMKPGEIGVVLPWK